MRLALDSSPLPPSTCGNCQQCSTAGDSRTLECPLPPHHKPAAEQAANGLCTNLWSLPRSTQLKLQDLVKVTVSRQQNLARPHTNKGMDKLFTLGPEENPLICPVTGSVAHDKQQTNEMLINLPAKLSCPWEDSLLARRRTPRSYPSSSRRG